MRSSRRLDAPATAGVVFDLVRRGLARSRGELAAATGLAPSTVSLRVASLLRHGLLEESASDKPTGGRQSRVLGVDPAAVTVACATLGTRHVTIRLAGNGGEPIVTFELRVDVAAGPLPVLRGIWEALVAELAHQGIPETRLAGLTLGLPAPVDSATGMVSSSAQLPGWDQRDLRAVFRQWTDVPIILANDANLLAVAEFLQSDPPVREVLAVKIGSRIGSGVIADGKLLTGASGAAGEVSHSPSTGASVIRCFCGTPNCLEAVASGSAIVARLRAAGHDIATTSDLVALASSGDPNVLDALRESGQMVGEVLAGFVNFLNPALVVFGGALSAADAHVAAIRGEIFRRCLPVVTADLDIRVGRAGADAEVTGGIQLALDAILTVESVDRLLATGTLAPGADPVRDSASRSEGERGSSPISRRG